MGLQEILSISRDLSVASLVCSANHMHDSVCPGASTGDLCREMPVLRKYWVSGVISPVF